MIIFARFEPGQAWPGDHSADCRWRRRRSTATELTSAEPNDSNQAARVGGLIVEPASQDVSLAAPAASELASQLGRGALSRAEEAPSVIIGELAREPRARLALNLSSRLWRVRLANGWRRANAKQPAPDARQGASSSNSAALMHLHSAPDDGFSSASFSFPFRVRLSASARACLSPTTAGRRPLGQSDAVAHQDN